MGGLRKQMPVTFWVYLIGAVALAGIFPFAGFWSKDEILLEAAKTFSHVYWMLGIAAFFTAFYMGRQIWMVFFGAPRTQVVGHAEESPRIITLPLMVLAVLSTIGGVLSLPVLHTMEHWLEHTLGEFLAAGEEVSGWLAISWGGLNRWWRCSPGATLAAIYFSSWSMGATASGQPDPQAIGLIFRMEHK
jgi:NADH:ubiquinone oxidoreductase subunit 5 (subunit L)/multisubunit Na+/H+ antiporter MnhA subunit